MNSVSDFPPGTRVLVADDCDITRAMLKGALEQWGIEVLTVADGKEALEHLLRPDPPRLALVDWMMPGPTGPEICRQVRAQDSEHYVYLVLLTALDDKEHLVQGFQSGADDYICKPFDPEELRVRLQTGARIVALQERLLEQNRFITKLFGRYMADEVAKRLLENPESLKMGGERRFVTVLMSDLRDFTPLSEALEPELVVSLLNRYLGRMVEVVTRHGGTIDEFIGDSILVIFGAPLSEGPESDAKRAVACAVEMQSAMEELNRESQAKNLPELKMGIGLSSGEVIVGNIGSHQRTKYSVIGTAVNLAARIESFTVGGQILISDLTLAMVKDLVRLDGCLRVKIKGVGTPISIFEIGGVGKPYDLFLPEVKYRVVDCKDEVGAGVDE